MACVPSGRSGTTAAWAVDDLKAATKRALEEIAGHFLDEGLRGPFEIGTEPWPVHDRGVYVVFDAWDMCVYVGKVCSSSDSERLRSRFREHLNNAVKRETWHLYYVLPLRAAASNAQVEKTEGWVARHLQPSGSQRSPNPARGRRRIRQVG